MNLGSGPRGLRRLRAIRSPSVPSPNLSLDPSLALFPSLAWSALACPSSHWDLRPRAIWTGLLKVTTFQSDVSRPGGQFPSNLRTFNLINPL